MAKKLTFFLWGAALASIWWFVTSPVIPEKAQIAANTLTFLATFLTVLGWGLIIKDNWED